MSGSDLKYQTMGYLTIQKEWLDGQISKMKRSLNAFEMKNRAVVQELDKRLKGIPVPMTMQEIESVIGHKVTVRRDR